MFAWISRQVYGAVVGAFHKAFADLGVIDSDATDPAAQAAAVRAAMDVAAIGDRPERKRKA